MYGANTTSSKENKGMEGKKNCVFFSEWCIGFYGEGLNFFNGIRLQGRVVNQSYSSSFLFFAFLKNTCVTRRPLISQPA
jgi:hypothetical protein